MLNKETIYAAYLTLGYPNLDTSIEAMVTLAQAGADIIEVGVPFSDPIADGPIIQNSSTIALRNGVIFDDAWKAVKEIKKRSKAEVLIMTYSNLVIQNGVDEIVIQANKHGLNGLILPDMPLELYPQPLFELNPIFLVSPNTKKDRIEKLAKTTGPFLYVTSQLNVTGKNNNFDTRLRQILSDVEAQEKFLPKLLGFGVSNSNDVEKAKELGADGVVIGSALIQALSRKHSISDLESLFTSILEN